ncbi:uncharacterized protein LOC141900294 [Tubulanus polymorphus]|uniref:uncharacterized protein LOC141900294 n=1 Tax=Tubulanus polymorphus TaxID=672921 RepID=UPI003DA6B7E9
MSINIPDRGTLRRYMEVILLLLFHVSYSSVLLNLGVIMYDIQAQNKKSINDSTYLYISQGLGCFLANISILVGSTMLKAKYLLLISMLFPGIFWMIVGFSSNFILTNTCVFLATLFAEATSVVSLVYCSEIWGVKSATIFNTVLTGIPIGNIISPLLYTPFLSESAVKHSQQANAQRIGCYERHKLDGNWSNSTLEMKPVTPDIQIYIPICINSAVFIVVAIFFYVCQIGNQHRLPYEELDKCSTQSTTSDKKGTFLGFLVLACVGGIISVIGNLTTQFAVECYEGTSTVGAAHLLSVYQAIVMIDRIVMTIFLQFTGTTKLLCIHLLIGLSGVLLLTFTVGDRETLWVSFVTMGVAIGSAFPMSFGWVKERFSPSPIQFTIVIFGASTGVAFSPIASIIINHTAVFSYSAILTSLFAGGCLIVVLTECVRLLCKI